MYRIDMYYDAGGVLIPLHKPMALITDGLRSASVCHAESNYLATPIDPEFAPSIRAKRSRASLGKPKTQMLDYCLALELMQCGAKIRWQYWNEDDFIAVIPEHRFDRSQNAELSALTSELLDQQKEVVIGVHGHILRYDSETRMLSLGWVAEQAHTLLNGWQLCRNQRPDFEFFY